MLTYTYVSEGKFELLYKGGNTYSLLGWNDHSFSYDYFNGTEWVRKWDLNSNFSELGTGTFYGWCILRVQGGVGYLYITDTNIKSTDTIAFNESLEIVGVVYKQLSSIVVTNRNGGFLVTVTFDGMENYNNYLVGFEYTVSR